MIWLRHNFFFYYAFDFTIGWIATMLAFALNTKNFHRSLNCPSAIVSAGTETESQRNNNPDKFKAKWKIYTQHSENTTKTQTETASEKNRTHK